MSGCQPAQEDVEMKNIGKVSHSGAGFVEGFAGFLNFFLVVKINFSGFSTKKTSFKKISITFFENFQSGAYQCFCRDSADFQKTFKILATFLVDKNIFPSFLKKLKTKNYFCLYFHAYFCGKKKQAKSSAFRQLLENLTENFFFWRAHPSKFYIPASLEKFWPVLVR